MPRETGAPASPPATLIVQVGGWLFRQRSWLPLPIVFVLLVVGWREADLWWVRAVAGPAVVVAAEGLRLWAVHHIGVISRTRAERTGPLVDHGPFALLRNPLYVGNIGIWVGFALSAGLFWFAPVVVVVLGLEYHAIVRWEEQLLASRLGDGYRSYLGRVPRWWPNLAALGRAWGCPGGHAWGDTFFSERSTLVAVVLGFALLWVKGRLGQL